MTGNSGGECIPGRHAALEQALHGYTRALPRLKCRTPAEAGVLVLPIDVLIAFCLPAYWRATRVTPLYAAAPTSLM